MEEVSAVEAFAKFKPESCVFVISVDKTGRPNGMIASLKTRCSYEPDMFAVCLWKEGNTQRLILESGEFVVAVPNMSMLKEVEFFGSVSGKTVDKFKETGLTTVKAKFVKAPLLRNAAINIECKLENHVECGDHIMFIGRVAATHINRDKKISSISGKRTANESSRKLTAREPA